MNQSPHPKNSGRRRNARNGTPQKTYASENDAANYRHALSDSPYTPQKLASNGTAVHPQVQSTQKKPRNRNTSTKKNRQDRQSPTQPQAIPLAFAGASFHASPAPNSLPIPSFLARATSAPDSPSIKSPVQGPSQELSPPTTDSEENSSPSPLLAPVSRNDESPLEFFFKADRAEKARVRRASSANAAGFLAGPFSPPHDSPREPSTFPKLHGISQPQSRRPTVQRNPSSGIPSVELDGTPGKPFGHAFSTPYSERIKAARSKNTPATPSASSHDNSDRSEALKRFLGVGMASPTQPSRGQPQYTPQQVAQPRLPRGMLPASVMTGQPNPHGDGQYMFASSPAGRGQAHLHEAQSSHHAPADTHSDQARKLEDSLRRVLKLGPN